jgi:hypothetical protein
MAYIISSDDIKESLAGYDPSRAEEFHEESTRLADKAFEEALKNRSEDTVVVMSGGSASGKSEYVSAYLEEKKVIVYDGTSSSFTRASTKIEKALKFKKKIEVHAVWPADFTTALEAFFSRDRQFSLKHFYRTHSDSRSTLLRIAQEYPEIPITIIVSDYNDKREDQKMEFKILTDKNKDDFIEFLKENQYNEEEIKRAQGLYDI